MTPEKMNLPGRIGLVLCLVLVLCGTWPVYGQAGQGYYNPKDDEYRLLGLKRSKEAYDAARQSYERQKTLYDKKLVSKEALENAERLLSSAEVDYQQSLLSVIFEKQYVSVDRAVKYQSGNGQMHVRLTLKNTSGGSAEYKKLLGIEDKLFEALQPDVVNDVYVSLLDDQQSIISQPYEAKIDRLSFGQPVTIDFELLQDLDAVTVNLIYGSGTTSSRKILLRKDASVNKVIVQSQQFAQEVELGESATYDLNLELFSGSSNTFLLEVVGLPDPIGRYFLDPTTQARLSQFKFTQGANTRKAALQVTMPVRPTGTLQLDKPIPFYVLVIPEDQAADLEAYRRKKDWTPAELDARNVGYVRLEMVPRGQGELLVRAPQLFHRTRPGGEVEMTVEVVNEGTRRLDNVQIAAEPPLGWTKTVTPETIPVLEPGKEQVVRLRFTPPGDVPVGQYEVRLRTSSYSENQPVYGEDKTVKVEVTEEANLAGTSLVVLAILGLVTGIVVFGIRLTKR